MTVDDKRNLKQHMTTAIASRVGDPAAWLTAVRDIAERTGRVDPARCLPLPTTLAGACSAVVDEADRQSMSGAQVHKALLAWCEEHES